MTVSPAYWISNSLQAVESLLLACPTYATLGMDASTTYWQDVRSGAIDAPYSCIVMMSGSEDEQEANRTPRRSNTLAVYLVWPIANQVGDTDKDKTKRATNAFGQLLSEIADIIGTSTYIARATRSYEPPTRTNDKDDQDEQANAWEAAITFTWDI